MPCKLRRIIAFIIDYNLVFLIPMLLLMDREMFLRPSLGRDGLKMLLMFALIPALALLRDLIFYRASIGKLITGIRIVNADGTKRVAVGNIILRNITFFIFPAELIVLLITGRTLGDRMTKTAVVRRKDQK